VPALTPPLDPETVLIEGLVKIITISLASIVEGVAAVIIAHATFVAILQYTLGSLKPMQGHGILTVRLNLGKALALTLEFLLAADILRTAVLPTWEDIGKLGAIAALRTLLNYFLERELKHDPEIKNQP
jgi:uncharacterized membrane protein